MIELLIEDGVFGLIVSEEPFLGFPGEVFLIIEDTEIPTYGENPEFLFPEVALDASDMSIETVLGDALLLLSSSDFDIEDGVIDVEGYSPKFNPGPLPVGLDLISGNPARISGVPESGTEGLYEITLVADNGVLPNAEETIILRVS